ncbi:MAG: hypothetical protein PUP92_16420 [Rhizonema sp. PD38]|nr:hypothetical protein [Rhizonema sp. PD38]
MSLQSGIEAVMQGRYQEAVKILEQFCRSCADQSCSEYNSAQVWLVRAYQGTGDIGKAMTLCEKLMKSENLQARHWAEQMCPTLPNTLAPHSSGIQKNNRAATASVKLAMGGVGVFWKKVRDLLNPAN